MNGSAHSIVAEAISNGELTPQPCEKCGAPVERINGRRTIHAHHDDYSKPLEVRWLCRSCHQVHHASMRKPVAKKRKKALQLLVDEELWNDLTEIVKKRCRSKSGQVERWIVTEMVALERFERATIASGETINT